MEIGLRRFLSDLATRRCRSRQAVGGMFAVFLLAGASPEAVGLAVGSALCAGGLLIRLWTAGQLHKNVWARATRAVPARMSPDAGGGPRHGPPGTAGSSGRFSAARSWHLT